MVYVSVETRRTRTNRRCYLCIEKKIAFYNSNTYLIIGFYYSLKNVMEAYTSAI